MLRTQGMQINVAVAAALLAVASVPLHAQVRITEAAPWGSGNTNTPYQADWFELTNVGSTAVDISGWTMDDDSANSNSAFLAGITSIAPGESVIFIERGGSINGTTLRNSFLASWFGSNVPAGLQVGTYTQGVAGGVGLSATADQVNIYSGSAGTLQASISFGASSPAPTLRSFDNAAGLDGQAVSILSQVNVNGAFQALNNVNGNIQIGSPGTIAAVPEPETYVLMGLGLALCALGSRRRQAALTRA